MEHSSHQILRLNYKAAMDKIVWYWWQKHADQSTGQSQGLQNTTQREKLPWELFCMNCELRIVFIFLINYFLLEYSFFYNGGFVSTA